MDINLLKELAEELDRAGAHWWAARCWNMLYRLAPFDSELLVGHLSGLVARGRVDQMDDLLRRVRRTGGFSPSRSIWLAGKLAVHGYLVEAGNVLAMLEDLPQSGARLVKQSPSIVSGRAPRKFGKLAAEMKAPGVRLARDEGMTWLKLSRLCFTMGHLDVAAGLYRETLLRRLLSWTDRVAVGYARLRADPDGSPGVTSDEIEDLLKVARPGPDALAMLSCLAVSVGDTALAQRALEQAIQNKYGSSKHVQTLLADGVEMLRIIASLRTDTGEFGEESLGRHVPSPAEGIPKVFVCGFGWSGSGAVYDDIRAVDSFCEFEGGGEDPILNEDSGTEVTFIQSSAGLGDLWRHVRSGRSVEWLRLWDLCCFHVLGLAPIGYSNYKSCAAAANHVRRYGPGYTTPFREFFRDYAALRAAPARGGLLSLLRRTTESLCEMLVERNGGKAVLFNNAVFGRDVQMLEIFQAYRAVAVFRDPLDVYADRKEKDKNHWRTPRQMAEFYGRGLARYVDYRAAASAGEACALREVPFERFVRDGNFRSRVRSWLLSGLPDNKETRFDARASSKNIGFHLGRIDDQEKQQLASATTAHRQMLELSDKAWAGD